MNLDKIINIIRNLNEEAPTMSLGAGAVAGTHEAGDEPPVNKRKKKERKYMKGPGRKMWMLALKGKNVF